MYFVCVVNMTSLYFSAGQRACPSHMRHNRTATMYHSRFHSARHVATELTRPNSSGLCHLVCHSATRVWDQSSWHRWAATASNSCVVQLGAAAVADWWCSWPMATSLGACVRARNGHFEHTLRLSIVLSVFDELYISSHVWCSRWGSKSAL